MPFMGDYGTYKTRSLTVREDSDGKQWLYARALSGSTAKSPYVLMGTAGTTVMGTGGTGCGYIATAPFDTGAAASVSLFIGYGNYYYSIAGETLASGADGWFQIGGPCVSATLPTCSATTGSYYEWVNASCTSVAYSVNEFQGPYFAIAMTSNTGGLPAGATAATYTCHDIYLLGRPCFGTT